MQNDTEDEIGRSLFPVTYNCNSIRWGVHPDFLVKFDFEIAIDQQTDQTFEGFRSPDSGCPRDSHAHICSKLCPIIHLSRIGELSFQSETSCSICTQSIVFHDKGLQ